MCQPWACRELHHLQNATHVLFLLVLITALLVETEGGIERDGDGDGETETEIETDGDGNRDGDGDGDSDTDRNEETGTEIETRGSWRRSRETG